MEQNKNLSDLFKILNLVKKNLVLEKKRKKIRFVSNIKFLLM